MRRFHILAAACGALSLLAGCSGEPSDPFSYVKVSGKVAYDDGSLVKVPDMLLIFHPLTSPIDPKTCPHSGMTLVNVATGEFLSVTTWRPGDGVVHGKHKVTLSRARHKPLPADQVPPEYFDPQKTPLEVDTDHWSGVLTVRKPR